MENRLVYGVGDTNGEMTKDENHKKLKQYSVWVEMIRRCYSEKEWVNPRNKSYKGCLVCDEWLNYSNYKKWYNDNSYSIENEIMCVDKDILEKGNKIYCPKKCIFVPNNINVLFTNSRAVRGDYPVGVTYRTDRNIYVARSCDGTKKRVHLGNFHNPEDAFYAYKRYKEKLIKQIADTYKSKIPVELYEALYRYEVEITD